MRARVTAMSLAAAIAGCGGDSGGGEGREDARLCGCVDDSDCPVGTTCLAGCCDKAPLDGSAADRPPGAPELLPSPTELDFGAPRLGVATGRVLTIASVGDGPLHVSRVEIVEEDDLAEFSSANDGDVDWTIDVGDALDVTVLLLPEDTQADNGELRLTSDDPDGVVVVPLVSRLEGDVVLAACVLEGPDPLADCADPEEISFDGLDYGATETGEMALHDAGTGNRPLEVYDLLVPDLSGWGELFAVEAYVLEGEPPVETPVEPSDTAPFLLPPGDETFAPPLLYVRVTYTAGDDGGTLPPEVLRIVSNDPGGDYEIPIVGEQVGCPDGFEDVNGLPADGCEATVCPDGIGDCDGDVGNGCETALTSLTDCGACGAPCGLTNAAASCATGDCQVASCDGGFGSCDGLDGNGCELTLDTIVNCGACGSVCALANASETCASGTCTLLTCAPGFGDCDGDDATGCEASLASLAHCGACGAACEVANASESCATGTCVVIACGAGWGDCDGDGTDCETATTTLVDCGACGVPCDLANASASCAAGTCALVSCAAGWGDCDAAAPNGCETPLTTATDCAACATACDYANASESCASGSCVLGACAAGFGDCDGSVGTGCESPLATLANCGACGAPCDLANASESCATGTCTLASCGAGFGNCDGDVSDGCETPLNTTGDCGACGAACSLVNAGESCATGACVVSGCDPGWGDCDGAAVNGCEADLGTSETNCGACGTACTNANGTTACLGASCVPSCAANFGDCDGDPNNGCEAAVCGSCGSLCVLANASESCASGTCALVSCDAGWGNCDGVVATGCETSLTTIANCGVCGTACANPNGATSCIGGVCTPICAAGFGSCDGDPADGCETALTTLTDCVGCGVGCALTNASESCSTGSCVITSCAAGFGDCDGATPNGCETGLTTVADCGACTTACTNANGTTSCTGGACAPGCSAGFANCDGDPNDGCEASTTTLANCGGCGTSCARANASESCATGTCALVACDAGFGNCDSIASNGCEATLTTTSNCGSCGATCTNSNGTTACMGGACSPSCAAGFASCDGDASDGCETDLVSDVANCGACAATCTNANGTAACVGGACSPTCAVGYGNCDGVASNGCEAPLNTLAACGSCGTICDLSSATESCATGACTLTGCSAGFGNCDVIAGNGCETPLTTAINCGACGATCTNANGTTSCTGGACAPTCAAGYGSCDANPNNGCETSTRTLTNCGACGTACALANASESCSTGTCTISSCDAGFGNCDGIASSGCEVSLTTTTNCGSCGTICTNANGTTSCSGGVCAPTCAAGYGNCDGNPDNGCEAALNTISSCGDCGVFCDLANASESCATGTCTLTSCSAGFGNCDGVEANGCEGSLTTLTNCGVCGTPCALANASELCSGGTCTRVSCSAGFGDCNGIASDGCELALTTTSDCGACGTACTNAAGTTSCTGGVCTPICAAGYGNCDANPDNGCETSLTTLTNCGSCGTACALANATESCTTGTCTLGACAAGFGNCDGVTSTGCETSLTTTSNCAICGTTCTNANGTTSCTGGVCVPSCTAGFASCDGNPNNGCETNLNASSSSCGACGTTCANANGTTSCSGGVCSPICSAGYDSCDSNPNNGCEQLLTTLAHCGVCGSVCDMANASESCATGTCALGTCTSGFATCDAIASNGCETTLGTSSNCSSCGNTCAYSCTSAVAGCQYPDTCAAPFTISGANYGPTTFSDNMSNYASNVAGSCGSPNDDAIHSITIPMSGGNTNFSSIIMDSTGSAIDTSSHITTTCGSVAAERQYASIVCGGSTGAGATCADAAGTSEILRACGMPSATYYATLDSSATTGAWTLSLTVDNVSLDTCIESGNVSDAPFTFTQTTVGKTDDYEFAKFDGVDNTCAGPSTTECGRPNGAPGGSTSWDCAASYGQSGNDAVFYYRASAGGFLTVTTSGSSYDTVLYVKNACMSGCSVPSGCLACNDDHDAPNAATWSQVYRVPVTAGTVYYIFVDGNGAANGTFVLNVTFSPI